VGLIFIGWPLQTEALPTLMIGEGSTINETVTMDLQPLSEFVINV
jgi:hypothetical protein